MITYLQQQRSHNQIRVSKHIRNQYTNFDHLLDALLHDELIVYDTRISCYTRYT